MGEYCVSRQTTSGDGTKEHWDGLPFDVVDAPPRRASSNSDGTLLSMPPEQACAQGGTGTTVSISRAAFATAT